MQTFLLTGCAGFIGSHTTEMLINKGHKVIGIDNFDDFYPREIKEKNISGFINHPDFQLIENDITEKDTFNNIPEKIDFVIHFAAKAGVRPSIENPGAYVKTNIEGTQNILEWMKQKSIKKMLFASSSSVYGNNKKHPFSEYDNVDSPISPYAFTKRSCEMLTNLWHQLYGIDVINLRFFTVYGPRQRPDLAIRKFASLIMEDKAVSLFGEGDSARDYTYIDDILSGIYNAIDYLNNNNSVYEIINLGNSSPIKLIEFVRLLYQYMEKEENLVYMPMQIGDVNYTYADIKKASDLLNFNPQTKFSEGLKEFIKWLKENKQSH